MSQFVPLFRRIAHHAAARPDATALVFGKSSLDYATLLRRIAGSAHALRRKGVARGEHVLLCMENSPELVVAYFAVHAAGGTACPLPSDSPADSVADLQHRTSPRLILSDRDDLARSDLPLSFTDETADELPDINVAADDPSDILFTSGTTGRRKGVVLSHGNIAAAAENISSFIGNGSDDHEAVPLPLAHSFGLGRLRSMAHVGNSILLTRSLADAPGLLRQMMVQKATGLALVPSGVEILRRTLGDHLGRLEQSLKYIELGSAAIRADTRDWLVRTLPQTRICHHYGLTEASRAAFLDLADTSAPAGAVGKPSPGVTIEIVDQAGRPLPPGQGGEVLVRGKVVAQAYFDDPDLTRERMTGNGFRTGDAGFLDSEGYLHLTGRLDDIINVGGKKVAPAEVEAVLLDIEGVGDAACVGEADPDGLLGQVVVAFVVPQGRVGEEELARQAASRLEAHKRPVRYNFVDALPRTASGKLQRFRLRTG